MSIAVTLVGDDHSYDLRVPSEVPLALLDSDLQRLTGVRLVSLARSTGEVLDPELSLRDHDVRDGAILQLHTREDALAIYDDIVDLALETESSHTTAASMSTAGITAAASVLLTMHGGSAVLGLLAAVAVVLSGIAPRAAIRLTRLTEHADARDAASRARVALAHRTSRILENASAATVLAAGVALTSSGSTYGIIGGWCCIVLVLCRTSPAHRAPAALALAMQRLAGLLTAVTPAVAIAASGLLPGLGP